jgi:hypothetical protein
MDLSAQPLISQDVLGKPQLFGRLGLSEGNASIRL